MNGGGALDSSVTLEEVFTVIGARRVPLAPELAGYLVLEIAEHADPSGGDVDPKAVFVSEEGTVALVKPRREVPAGSAETSIRAMLMRLLDASGSQTPALTAAGKRRATAGLPALAEELEIALIPVNRAAGRRALARLAREVRRVTLGVGRNALPSSSDSAPSSRRASYASYPQAAATEVPAPRSSSHSFSRDEDPTTARGQIPAELLEKATPGVPNEMPTMQFDAGSREPSPSQADVDSLISDFGVSGGGDQEHARDLKAMAGLEPTPSPPEDPPRVPSSRPTTSDDGIESLLSTAEAASPPPSAGRRGGSSRVAPPTPEPLTHPTGFHRGDAQMPTQPSHLKKTRGSLPSAPRVESRRGSGVLVALAIVAVAAGGFAVWQLRPAEMKTAPQATPSAATSASAPHVASACKATLVVTDVPMKAEVLLRQGQAPVDVEKMPVGARLEFVATAEGFAPKRLVVPAGATWDTGADNKPRFEAAMQLDKSTAKAGGTDPWPLAEQGTEVGGQGPPGTIHVVATPRGADVWMVAGMGPEARVEQLRCDRDVDVLLAGPGAYRKRLHVAGGDFAVDAADPVPAPGKASTRIAHVSAK